MEDEPGRFYSTLDSDIREQDIIFCVREEYCNGAIQDLTIPEKLQTRTGMARRQRERMH
jgi:hypothetical protein